MAKKTVWLKIKYKTQLLGLDFWLRKLTISKMLNQENYKTITQIGEQDTRKNENYIALSKEYHGSNFPPTWFQTNQQLKKRGFGWVSNGSIFH